MIDWAFSTTIWIGSNEYLIFILLFYFLTLQYCIGFAIHQNESATGIHVFAILNPPPSSLPIPSPWVVPVHQRQASSTVHWTWTSNSFHMILYMFQCHSPKSSHRLPFPQSPKDCSIHQCLFCCLVYRVIVIIFLNSIYIVKWFEFSSCLYKSVLWFEGKYLYRVRFRKIIWFTICFRIYSKLKHEILGQRF